MNKPSSILIALFLFAIMDCIAQDVIITLDAQKIDAKITEVSKTEIKYKEADNPDGPTFILSTEGISSIIYSNGKVSLYSVRQSSDQVTAVAHDTLPKKTIHPQPTTKGLSIDFIPIEVSPTEDVDNRATIILRDGTSIQCQLTKMTHEMIYYIHNNSEHGISTTEITEIIFANGQIKHYSSAGTTTNISPIVNTYNHHITKEAINSPKKNSEQVVFQYDDGRIYRDGNEYMYHNTYISTKEVGRILETHNHFAYKEWQKGRKMTLAGSIVTGVGAGLALGSLGCIPVSIGATAGLCVSGLLITGTGAILVICASAKYEKGIEIYNKKYNSTMNLNFHLTPTETGIALRF